MKTDPNFNGGSIVGFSHGLNNLFDSLFQNDSFFGVSERAKYPLCNVEWDDQKAILYFEIPGVEKNDIDIQLEGDVLTINGERKIAYSGKVIQSESFAGKFSRKFRLPYAVESDSVQAVFKNGMLSLTLPRKAETKPKKIEINIA